MMAHLHEPALIFATRPDLDAMAPVSLREAVVAAATARGLGEEELESYLESCFGNSLACITHRQAKTAIRHLGGRDE